MVEMNACFPCFVGSPHVFHDDGEPADSIFCEDISGDWGVPQALHAQREEQCAQGRCICDEIERKYSNA